MTAARGCVLLFLHPPALNPLPVVYYRQLLLLLLLLLPRLALAHNKKRKGEPNIKNFTGTTQTLWIRFFFFGAPWSVFTEMPPSLRYEYGYEYQVSVIEQLWNKCAYISHTFQSAQCARSPSCSAMGVSRRLSQSRRHFRPDLSPKFVATT